ncbi:hypothetical protein I6A60_38660 [Frankia sp. AgB1.9]|uniref:hypothetical protein n=1 Tax=unclassified Frankia TaxID=2632575 RepID=UPI00193262EB|nr:MULTISPECIES: hypothetical protein [unclassified Frankia]MBL7487778.1 hypothetical protein [Frankia sp. AgW1.1]MBL7553712.1 hypothetical protein [Frankia sp. AgB1.9]MBL7622938.1 hypothetical protein [Frankia sp. AgB1.8]
MSDTIFRSDTPAAVAGADVTPEDMARVTESDWLEIRTIARRYCRTVNASRSRKRMDGNTTVAGGPFGQYGTADISDDVTQDAVLLFAQRLATVSGKFEPASLSVETREPDSWLYVTQTGRVFVADRHMIMFWAVRQAGRRNGFRTDERLDPIDATPGAQYMQGLARAEFVAVGTYMAGMSDIIWQAGWDDGSDFPILADCLNEGSQAEDLGRAGVISRVAQKHFGGRWGSGRPMRRTREAAMAELRELTRRLDEARDSLVYASTRRGPRSVGALPDE